MVRKHQLDYEFTLEDGRPATGTMWVAKSEWDRAAVGDEVTVLHYAGHATPSVVYEHGDYLNAKGDAAGSR